jgi:hypothetical protein
MAEATWLRWIVAGNAVGLTEASTTRQELPDLVPSRMTGC